MRVNGQPGARRSASRMADGGNILDLGRRVAARLAQIAPTLPLGVQLHRG